MKRYLVCFASLLYILAFTSQASASLKERLIKRLWQRQEQGISHLISCWRSGSTSSCKYYLEEIVSAEVDLLAYGVSPKDPRLVCGLAAEDEKLNLNHFVYEVILNRFEQQTGWKPSSNFPVSIEK